MSDSHGHGHDDHGHDDHEHGHDDKKKGPKLPHLEDHLEDKVNEEFDKDIKKFKETFTKDNLIDIKNMAGEAHDSAYESFKKRFEELANDHHEPLAERGKELSQKHLNELIYAYLKPFAEKAHGAKGKSLIESYDKIKFDGENAEHEKEEFLDNIAEQLGLYSKSDRNHKQPYMLLKKALKENKERHYSVANDIAHLVKEETRRHHASQILATTIGKSKYHQKPKLALKALNEVGKDIEGFTGYEIDHDENGKSKFYKLNVSDMFDQLTNMAENKIYQVSEEFNKDNGLKYKKPHAEHEGNHGGHEAHH